MHPVFGERKHIILLLFFYYRNKSCFSFLVKTKPETTFLPVIDNGDVYMKASAYFLCKKIVYDGALSFITKFALLTQYYILYSKAAWHFRQPACFLTQLSLLGITPSYLSFNTNMEVTISDLWMQFVYPKVQSKLDKKAFRFTAPNTWNNLEINAVYLVWVQMFYGKRFYCCKFYLMFCGLFFFFVTMLPLGQFSLVKEIFDLNETNLVK